MSIEPAALAFALPSAFTRSKPIDAPMAALMLVFLLFALPVPVTLPLSVMLPVSVPEPDVVP